MIMRKNVRFQRECPENSQAKYQKPLKFVTILLYDVTKEILKISDFLTVFNQKKIYEKT